MSTTRCGYRLLRNFTGRREIVKTESVLSMPSLHCPILFTEELRSASAVALGSISRISLFSEILSEEPSKT